MADYQEGHVLTNKATGEKIVLQNGQWVPQPAQGSAASAPAVPQPGKTPQVREPQIQNPTFFEDVGQTALPELTRGVVGLATAPNSIPNFLGGLVGLDMSGNPWPSYQSAIDSIESKTGPLAKPQTMGGKFVGTGLQMLPGAGFGPGGLGAKGLQLVGGAVGSEGLGQLTEGTAAEPWMRMLGGVAGTTVLPKMARGMVTPNPYNPKMLADTKASNARLIADHDALQAKAISDYRAQRDFVGANTSFPEDARFLATINALKGGPVDVAKYRTDAFAKMTPQEQAAARRAANPPAPWHSGPGAPPPAPPPSWTGAQVAHMDDAIRADIARGQNVPELRMLQQAHDRAMAQGTHGTPFAGSWAALGKQRAQMGKDIAASRQTTDDAITAAQKALDDDVEARIRGMGGGPGRSLPAVLGSVALNVIGHKAGLPGWGPEAMLAAATGGGLGGAWLGHKARGWLPSFKDAIPGVAAYRRNQIWQPGPATQFSPTRNAAMLSSGDLIFPALAHKPPE